MGRCVICEFVVSTLQGLLASQEVEQQFLNECAEACVYLPAAEQQPVRARRQQDCTSRMAMRLTVVPPVWERAVQNVDSGVRRLGHGGGAQVRYPLVRLRRGTPLLSSRHLCTPPPLAASCCSFPGQRNDFAAPLRPLFPLFPAQFWTRFVSPPLFPQGRRVRDLAPAFCIYLLLACAGTYINTNISY